jgi:hypothetical protein
MDRGTVEKYVKQSDNVLNSSPQMGEATTKAAILQSQKGISFLELLNWEIPENTQLEYSVEAFGNTYKVDYALILDGTPVAFLEAKGADTSLTADHEEQLSSYMTNENVTYGILTNGKQYRFFQRRVDASNVDVQKVGGIVLKELPNRLAVLNAYEKDAIESGESGKILGRINELREARRTLEADKDDLAVELSNTLADEVSDSISSLAETQAKELIDRLVADIDSEIDADRNESTEQADSLTQQSTDSIESTDSSGEYIIRIQNEDTTLATFTDGTQRDTMGAAVNYLVDNHDLISHIEPLPYMPGRKKIIINDQTSYPDNDNEMRAPQELSGGYYLETHDNKQGKKREIRRLAEHCGITVTFEGQW